MAGGAVCLAPIARIARVVGKAGKSFGQSAESTEAFSPLPCPVVQAGIRARISHRLARATPGFQLFLRLARKVEICRFPLNTEAL